jgi:hypothetical protein
VWLVSIIVSIIVIHSSWSIGTMWPALSTAYVIIIGVVGVVSQYNCVYYCDTLCLLLYVYIGTMWPALSTAYMWGVMWGIQYGIETKVSNAYAICDTLYKKEYKRHTIHKCVWGRNESQLQCICIQKRVQTVYHTPYTMRMVYGVPCVCVYVCNGTTCPTPYPIPYLPSRYSRCVTCITIIDTIIHHIQTNYIYI